MNFTFFSSTHGTFSRIDHILSHKSSLGKFKKIEIIPTIFSDHNTVHKNKLKTIKLLEENIGKTLSNINHSRILYDPPPRILKLKAKINKWDPIKLKSFCTTKETISKVKRQPSEWEKIIANEATNN